MSGTLSVRPSLHDQRIAAFRSNGSRSLPLLSARQVDSSVGGKTGVNHALGKNMIGAFYQPQCVLVDTETLNSLPDRELASGLAEVVKYGLIRDPAFVEWQEENLPRLLARYGASLLCARGTGTGREEEGEGEGDRGGLAVVELALGVVLLLNCFV